MCPALLRLPRLMVVCSAVSLITAPVPVLAQSILYVDDDAAVGGDGQAWTSAYKYLQDALVAAAGSGGAVTEIHVAGGTYKPDQGGGKTAGDRTAAFQLLNGVAMKGGFAGLYTIDSNIRNFTLFETILSGDLLGNDGANFANNTENSYHVVTGSGTNATAVLDGLTITAGNANGSGDYAKGGGVFIYQGTPSLVDCTLRSNMATSGGGMALASASPSLSRCTFLRNSASSGGGLYNDQANPSLNGCTFRENTGRSSGSAASNRNGSSPTFVDCSFEAQPGSFTIPLIYTETASAQTTVRMTNCTLRGNQGRAVQNGAIVMVNCLVVGNGYGGIYCTRSSSLVNCTIVGNGKSSGGYGVSVNGTGSVLSLANTIVWDNYDATEGSQVWRGSGATATLNSCCIQGWSGTLGGTNNTGLNPRLINAKGPDAAYGTADDDLRLGAGSPCIDMGDNVALPADTYDLDGDGNTTEPLPLDAAGGPRVFDVPLTPDLVRQPQAVVDIGALEASTPPQSTAVGVIYVDRTAQGSNDGTSWTNAFTDLQAALTAAKTLTQEVVELWVAAGTYKPAGPGGSKSVSFELADKLQLYGGFAGGQSAVYPGGETLRGQRNPTASVTTLSGDLNGDDGPDRLNNWENSKIVVTLNVAGASAVLDGFSITSACNQDLSARGGGVSVANCKAFLVNNCLFLRVPSSRLSGDLRFGSLHDQL